MELNETFEKIYESSNKLTEYTVSNPDYSEHKMHQYFVNALESLKNAAELIKDDPINGIYDDLIKVINYITTRFDYFVT